MKWLGLVIGLLLGLVMGKFEAAFALTFIGFGVGLVIDLMRSSTAKASADERVEKLERAVRALSLRLEAIETGRVRVATGPAAAPMAAPPSPEEEPLPEEEVPEAAPPVFTWSGVPESESEVSVTPAKAGAQSPVTAAQAGAQVPPPRRPVPPPQPEEPSAPNPIVAWLTGGNAIARVGLLILFFGLAFLLKYAADHSMFPPELRVGAVGAAGLALLIGGWRLRERRAAYGLGLQGGGVAVLYLTTFGALRLYHLLPPTAAFVMLAMIAVLSAFLAVAQDALVLAVFGTGGGFLAPILASSGNGSHVALFTYYLVLNFGIALVALRKSWRSLNLMGFAFTFFISAAWGIKFYSPEYLGTTEPFLIAFFLLYIAIAILQARPDAPDMRRVVDGTLVFGVPLAAFGLQAALMRGVEFGLSFSCIGAAATYLVLTALLKRTKSERFADLAECFLANGVVFATLAIPFALDARWTSAMWGLEGAAIVWVGLRQRRRLATAFGVLLQMLAGGAFYLGYARQAAGFPWIDAIFIGALLLAIAGLVTSRAMGSRSPWPTATSLAGPLFVWGLCWWLFAAHHDIQAFLEIQYRAPAYVTLFAATALVFSLIYKRTLAPALSQGSGSETGSTWNEARWPALALLPTLGLGLVATMLHHDHPFADFGWGAWTYAFIVALVTLRWHENETAPAYRQMLHAGFALLVAAVSAFELHWVAAMYAAPHTAWTIAAYAVAPCIVLMALSSQRAEESWPVRDNLEAYRIGAGGAFAVLLILWTFAANVTHDGRSDPLPYMPIINALDLAHVLVILAIAKLVLSWRRIDMAPAQEMAAPAVAFVSIAVFFWLNAVLLRSIHHYAGIPYVLGPMMQSVIVQAALSIFWTVLALALMLFATRQARRGIWIVGGVLMAVVVVKLFVIDLQHVTGIERIVSFIAVGLLMLLVGYVAPVPPRAAPEPKTSPADDEEEGVHA